MAFQYDRLTSDEVLYKKKTKEHVDKPVVCGREGKEEREREREGERERERERGRDRWRER